SLREDKPFVAINCGALPDSLLESELFGYKAGAFTNAVKDKPGHFSIANGGTVFLDEIGDTSPAFQVRLLRVLEEKEFTPLGAVAKEKTDVRIITATNKDLLKMVAQEKFRQDLFYRVNVVRLELLPLRHRMEDIPFLIQHFIDKLNRIQGKQVNGMDHDALELLMNHDFPGNIRELENIIEHSFVLCSEGNIKVQYLPSNLSFQTKVAGDDKNSSDPIKTAEARIIRDALKQNNYNRKAAAEFLGMHKSTLFRKINKFDIKLPKLDGRSKLV
ncbi:MAG: sigma 54-interacting transcriptional regulator, partial [Desulfobacteraceae bacterium]|nr:sigma 54-interacting transcriptional regulator [Desulfobacteraceae bacterium]